MPKRVYRVMYENSYICEAFIRANSEEEAKQFAEEKLDGGDFMPNPLTGDWGYFGCMWIEDESDLDPAFIWDAE